MLFLKGVNEILQQVRDLPEDLIKEGPEEAKRSPLELIATAVEEERKDKVVVYSFAIIESVFQQCGLPRARLPLNPEQALIASSLALVCVMSEQLLACPCGRAGNVVIAALYLGKRQ